VRWPGEPSLWFIYTRSCVACIVRRRAQPRGEIHSPSNGTVFRNMDGTKIDGETNPPPKQVLGEDDALAVATRELREKRRQNNMTARRRAASNGRPT